MNKNLKHPLDIVAEVLQVKRDSLGEDSAMGKTPNWDSLNHVGIISEIETNYETQIPDDKIMSFDNMKAIINLYDELSGNISLRKRIVKRFKSTFIGKILFK